MAFLAKKIDAKLKKDIKVTPTCSLDILLASPSLPKSISTLDSFVARPSTTYK